MNKFWNFIRDEDGGRVLRLEGPIDEDYFWGDEVTPDAFREELEEDEGDVTVWINSPGGNVFAAASIYTMLRDHKGAITVKIDAIAASAASVVAMAGDRVLMSPVAMLMVHDPMTIAMGNTKDMEQAIKTLDEVKQSIINAYHAKTGLSRNKISALMENETWMNAKKAVELGFADEILFAESMKAEPEKEEEADEPEKDIKAEGLYSTRIMGQTILNRLLPAAGVSAGTGEEPGEAETAGTDTEPEETGLTQNRPALDEKAEDLDENDSAKEEAAEETAEDASEEPTEDEPEETSADESAEETAVDESEETVEAEAETEILPDEPDTSPPVIGMDGKTQDGAMPYELLKKQLEFLK